MSYSLIVRAVQLVEHMLMLLFCSSSDVQFKYVYFNHTNLAQKTSIHGGCVRRSANVPADVLRLISDVNLDLNLYVFA